VDLTGFTQHARSRIFASRPAPLQVNYLGFPATMGADYIDYMIADKTVVPERIDSITARKSFICPTAISPTISSAQFQKKSSAGRRWG
jgi:hypothetical protein